MKKKIKFGFILTIIFFIILNILFIPKSNLNFDDHRYIAHAGGGYKEIIYSNSEESIMKSIENGYKLIELDLLITSDDFIVASHDWINFKKNCQGYKGELNNKPITLKEFKNCNYKIKKQKLNQLDENKINNLFKYNNEIFLVTDKIRNYKQLAKKFNFKERIIPEAFSLFDYLNARVYGFENILFPYKRYNFIYKYLFGVNLISVSYKDFIKNKKKISKLFRNGAHIFVYSSNDENFIFENVNKNITGVYVDFWDLNKQKCVSNSNCKSY